MTDRKLFTAELQRLRERGHSLPLAALNRPAIDGGPANAEVLEAIALMRQELKALHRAVAPHTLPEEDEEPGEKEEVVVLSQAQIDQQRAEVNLLKTELRALAVCIEQTKQEIAALRPPETDEDRLIAVTFELDAIVTATERATQDILESAEKIDNLVNQIQAQEKDSYLRQLVDEMAEAVVTIFESCNFQDITGQRITKIVNTLKYVEDRINAMVEIWGAEAFRDLPVPAEVHINDEAKLLNGPQLENKGISQDEIDKLFG